MFLFSIDDYTNPPELVKPAAGRAPLRTSFGGLDQPSFLQHFGRQCFDKGA